MKQAYQDIRFHSASLKLIQFIDDLIGSYMQQGFTLSVRQIYYQLVARDKIPNTERSYKNTAELLNRARLAGLIDWDAIEDRNRELKVRSRWNSGKDILQGCVDGFHMDAWDNQPNRVFVVVEKAALEGVLSGVCRRFDAPLLAARGYPSVSVVREMVMEHMGRAVEDYGQDVTVLHLGDHDPSGIDMTRDLEERYSLFMEGSEFSLKRIALNMDQIRKYKPPPNPAKTTDSRFKEYKRNHGVESWELDALDPNALETLVEKEIENLIDQEAWADRQAEIERVRDNLRKVANRFKD